MLSRKDRRSLEVELARLEAAGRGESRRAFAICERLIDDDEAEYGDPCDYVPDMISFFESQRS